MQWHAFTAKWFALYYPVLGLLFIGGGMYLMAKSGNVVRFFLERSTPHRPPPLIITLLKYYFIFTLPCLLFSFIPFSLPELLFSLWSLGIVYLAGTQLVRWKQSRRIIKNHPRKAQKMIQYMGAGMMAVSPLMFLLCYLVIHKLAMV